MPSYNLRFMAASFVLFCFVTHPPEILQFVLAANVHGYWWRKMPRVSNYICRYVGRYVYVAEK